MNRVTCLATYDLFPYSVVAKVDDDMLRHYCNEDLFLMEVQHRDADSYDLTLIELTGVEH